MRKPLLVTIALAALVGAGAADAADMPAAPVAPAPPPVWNWTGGYFGGHVGALSGIADISNPAGPAIYGDKIDTPGFLGGVQTGYNWQLPNTPLVVGGEVDLDALDSIGTNTCLAASGFFLSANCRSRSEITATVTGRLGFAVGPQKRTLLYLKGGFAGTEDKIDIATNPLVGFGPAYDTASTMWQWGWTAGAGIERALTPAWSLRLEYNYLAFGQKRNVPTPASFSQVIVGNGFFYVPTAGGVAGISQNIQEVTLGLNYRFNTDPWLGLPAKPFASSADASRTGFAGWLGGWEFQAGARYWYSSGKFQKDLGASTSSATANVLNSRLTYATNGNSGELYGRLESPDNLFIKGMVGGGGFSNGQMNDEDWLIFSGSVPYSNTVSDRVTGTIDYATADVGYDIVRAPDYKFGAFVGYNFFKDNNAAYGCVQIANPYSDCNPAIPNSQLVISENDTWNSLRVGMNGEFMLLPGVKLAADVAYVPYTRFNGVDIHWQRTDVPDINSPETGTGSGVQMDAMVSYNITPALRVGVGGRYWALWTNDNAYTNIFGTPCPCQTEPVKTTRYGLLAQADYTFDMPAQIAAK